MTGAVAEGQRAITLADGAQLPLLGLGVWQVRTGRECVDAVRWALELGYRHIDTAQAYRNEESVGQALRESGVPRNEVFVTTKFHPSRTDPVDEVERSLERLGVDRVDLYIVHWPKGGPTWAWPGMERARELGYARSIGVSNFNAAELQELLAVASVRRSSTRCSSVPTSTVRTLDACRENRITLETYSPLGHGRHLARATVKRIAQRIGRAPAQVLPSLVHRARRAADREVDTP